MTEHVNDSRNAKERASTAKEDDEDGDGDEDFPVSGVPADAFVPADRYPIAMTTMAMCGSDDDGEMSGGDDGVSSFLG